MNDFCIDILGLKMTENAPEEGLTDGVMGVVMGLRNRAKESKDWGTADFIRDELGKLNIKIKDAKDGASWTKD